VVDTGLSDHTILLWSLPYVRPPMPAVETVVHRPWRSLDVDHFRSVLSSSSLRQPDAWQDMDAEALSSLYDREMTTLLDQLIPARSIRRHPRPSDPYFDAECRAAKWLTRRLERAAAAAAKRPDPAATAAAEKAWSDQRRAYRQLRERKSEEFRTSTVATNRSSPHQLRCTVDQLLG